MMTGTGCTGAHACALCCAQLIIVRLARCKQLPGVSKGMLRLVLLAGGVLLKLSMNTAPDLQRFWGAALAGTRDLRLELLRATGQRVQQLAEAAAGGTFPGIRQLFLKVSLQGVLNSVRCCCKCWLSPALACCRATAG
jgi:hypothetical protein